MCTFGHVSSSSGSIKNSNSSSDASQPPLKRFRLLAADTHNRATAASTHHTTLDGELLAYGSEAASFTQTCGLSYWTQQQAKFPLLLLWHKTFSLHRRHRPMLKECFLCVVI